MKLKHLLSAALVAVTLFNFSSCKDDGGKWDYENAINIKNIEAECNSKSIKIEDLQDTIFSDTTLTIYAGSTDIPGQKIKFDIEYGIVGESLTKVENVSSVTLNLDEPFEEYTLNIVFWGEDEDGNISQKSDEVEVNFYYVPAIDFSVFRDFGKGECSTTIKWHFGHIKYDRTDDEYHYSKENVTHYDEGYYVVGENYNKLNLYDDDNYSMFYSDSDKMSLIVYKKSYQEPTEKELSQIKKKLSQMKVVIEASSDDVQCNIEPIEVAYGDADSIIVRLNDKGFEYSTKPVVGTINGKEHILYEEAYKYKFNVTLKMPVGDKVVEWSAQATSILIDQDAYAIDRELNVYRTVKIGDDIWTIDNYRGTKDPFLEYKTSNNSEYANAGFYFYCKLNNHRDKTNYPSDRSVIPIINSHIINGYELPVGSDWSRLESFFGIDNANIKYIPVAAGIEPFCLYGEDESEYEKYWAKNTPWNVFAPQSEDPMSFNVFAAGLYDKELDEIRWSNEVASFVCCDSDLDRPSHDFIAATVVSNKHKSIGHSHFGRDYSNVRLVKRGK